jgi:hypothetical protein
LDDCLGDGDNSLIETQLEKDFDAVDSIGIAKCCNCGVKLPVDDITIEKHSRDCLGDRSNKSPTWNSPSFSVRYALKTLDVEKRDSDLPSSGREATSTSYAELEDDSRMCTSADEMLTTDADETLDTYVDCGLDDWEDGFDAIGIAKCSHCGMKLPLDEEAIEEHLKTCKGEGIQPRIQPPPQPGGERSNKGKCCRCQRTISLDVDAVVAHSHVCPALITNQGSEVNSCGNKNGWFFNLGL